MVDMIVMKKYSYAFMQGEHFKFLQLIFNPAILKGNFS